MKPIEEYSQEEYDALGFCDQLDVLDQILEKANRKVEDVINATVDVKGEKYIETN